MKQSWFGKIILLLLILLSAGCFLFNSNKPMYEIHILPEKFKGVVMIIHSQKDGENIEIEHGAIIYKIPPTGILKTKNPLTGGLTQVKYYYGVISDKTEIKYVFDYNKISLDTICVFGLSTGTNRAGGPDAFDVTTYMVGTKKDVEKLSKDLDKLNFPN
jgi:hypothetical protein